MSYYSSYIIILTEVGFWCCLLCVRLPSCPSEVTMMLMFCCTSPFSFLLTHWTVALLWSLTVRVMVLLIVWLDTVVKTEYSASFSNRGHLMVGNGNPWLMHTQVRTPDWTLHPESFRIFGNTVKQHKQNHNKLLMVWNVNVTFLRRLVQSTHKSQSHQHTQPPLCSSVVLYRCTFQNVLPPYYGWQVWLIQGCSAGNYEIHCAAFCWNQV